MSEERDLHQEDMLTITLPISKLVDVADTKVIERFIEIPVSDWVPAINLALACSLLTGVITYLVVT